MAGTWNDTSSTWNSSSVSWDATGGTSNALAGTCTVQAANTGAFSSKRVLGGTATAVAANTGTLRSTRSLSGTATAVAANTGVFSSGRSLGGTATVHAANTGTLAGGKPLAGVATARAANTGALTSTRALAGTLTISAANSGTLSGSSGIIGRWNDPLGAWDSASVVWDSIGTGGSGVSNPLAGILTARAVNSGSLRVSRPLAGTATARAANTGTMQGILFTIVQHNYIDPATGTAVYTIPFNSAQVAGDLNIITIGWFDSNNIVSSVTDTAGNLYQVAVGPTVNGTLMSQVIYYCAGIKAALAGANIVTVTFSNQPSFPDIRIAEANGCALGSIVDVTAIGTGTTDPALTAGGVTTQNNDLLYVAGVTMGSFSGPGSGFTLLDLTSPNADIHEYQLISTVGTYTGSAAQPDAGAYILQMVAFKGLAASLKALAGTVTAQAANFGTLTTTRKLAGIATATLTSVANLKVTHFLAGTATARASNTGLLSVAGRLAGICTIRAANTGSLLPTRPLAGTVTVRAANTGSLMVSRGLSGVGTFSALSTGALTVTTVIPAASGSAADVQAAINAANNGQTVTIPAGTFTWNGNGAVNISGKGITLQGAGVGQTIINATGNSANAFTGVLQITQTTTNSTRVTGITFLGINSIGFQGTPASKPFRFDHSALTLAQDESLMCSIQGNAPGLLDHLTVTGGDAGEFIHQLGSAGSDPGDSQGWVDNIFPGSAQFVYMEDIAFIHSTSASSASAVQHYFGARSCIRSCTFVHCQIDCHGNSQQGQNTSTIQGTRWFEFYNLTFTNSGSGGYFALRDGSGVIFNITSPDSRNATQGVSLQEDSNAPYPVYCQIGRGIGGVGAQGSSPVYIWNYGTIPVFDNNEDGGRKVITLGTDYFAVPGTYQSVVGVVGSAMPNPMKRWQQTTDTSTTTYTYKPFPYPYPLDANQLPNPAGATSNALSGNCVVKAANTGTLRSSRVLAGTCTVRANNRGAFVARGAMVGTATARFIGFGTIGLARVLVGSATIRAQNTGSLSVIKPLAGTATIRAVNTGTLALSVRFTGTVTIRAANTGTLQTRRSFIGKVTVRAVNTGTLSVTQRLNGLDLIHAVNTGTLSVLGQLNGVCTIHAVCVGNLTVVTLQPTVSTNPEINFP